MQAENQSLPSLESVSIIAKQALKVNFSSDGSSVALLKSHRSMFDASSRYKGLLPGGRAARSAIRARFCRGKAPFYVPRGREFG